MDCYQETKGTKGNRRKREGGGREGETEVVEADIILCSATNRLKHALCLIFKTSTRASSSRL